MRPREVKEEQAAATRTDATFLEKLRDKIAEDARAGRR
jgi:hypothetical protein